MKIGEIDWTVGSTYKDDIEGQIWRVSKQGHLIGKQGEGYVRISEVYSDFQIALVNFEKVKKIDSVIKSEANLYELSKCGWENITGNTWYKTLYENGNTELCLIINPCGENHESDFILDLRAKDRLVNTNFSMSVKSLNDIMDTLRKLGILRNRRW